MASITKRVRKDGVSYRVRVSNGRRPDGSQIFETATFVPDPDKTDKQNQKALESFTRQFEEKVKSGTYLDGEKITFQMFSEIWLRDYARQQLTAKTVDSYIQLLNAHILPEIGNLKLSKIQPPHLNRLLNGLASSRKDGKPGGYSTGTVKRVHAVIESVYSSAIRWNIVLDNPAVRVVPPKGSDAPDQKLKYFTPKQAQTFLDLLQKEFTVTRPAHDRKNENGGKVHVKQYQQDFSIPLQLQLFFYLAIFTGCRRGELVALEWSDLDLLNNIVSISKTTVIIKGQLHTKVPKTAKSFRRVVVPSFVMDLAKQYRKQQLEYKLSIGDQWKGENYVFITWDGKQMRPETPYKAFHRIIDRYNKTVSELDRLPRIPLHGLRHTCATLLIAQHTDVKTVSARLGHSQTSTTMNIYAHELEELDRTAAAALAECLLPRQKGM